MNIKLVALGNVLMGDDGIAIDLAKCLEEQLNKAGIEVIYGETDLGFCISKVKEDDFLIILDAARLGGSLGELTMLNLKDYVVYWENPYEHRISFTDIIKLYYPELRGVIIAIEVTEVEFHYGLSIELKEELPAIADSIMNKIEYIVKQGDGFFSLLRQGRC